ncbi:hypothetical protein VTN77DRAFT_550 [Rasamsonia byssochlamydoides]|uniref:uncharacterized protein n=1 Tax=Rasamsonia byssochlamydoides TaxID=89139 RepID=UPI003743BB7A
MKDRRLDPNDFDLSEITFLEHESLELDNIDPSEITFLEELGESDESDVFLVSVRGREYAMKVHMDLHDIQNNLSGYIRENTAYRRLHSYGFCDRGYIPRFYGSIEDIDTAVCGLWLLNFAAAEVRPCAIFLEYLPAMGKLTQTFEWNYTRERWAKVHEIITLMHAARVCYGRTKPKTMLVPGEGEEAERILCYDLDVSLTYPNNYPLSDEEKQTRDRESCYVNWRGYALTNFNGTSFSVQSKTPGSPQAEIESGEWSGYWMEAEHVDLRPSFRA